MPWPGLDGQVARSPRSVAEAAPYAANYQTDWLSAAGTIILIADIISLLVLRVGTGQGFEDLRPVAQPAQVGHPDHSHHPGPGVPAQLLGHDLHFGPAFASTGVLFPFFAAFIGWLGVALTGSDTSSNALFANLQKVTAQQLGLSPNLAVGANSSGGVLGKMISQNLAVGTSATGLQGREGDLLRWS